MYRSFTFLQRSISDRMIWHFEVIASDVRVLVIVRQDFADRLGGILEVIVETEKRSRRYGEVRQRKNCQEFCVGINKKII